MAIYTNLPVFEDSYQLLLQLTKWSRNFERDVRHTTGERLKQVTTDMMVLIYKANKAPSKSKLIGMASEKLVEVKLLCRVLCDLKQISLSQHAQTMDWTVNIAKQLNAWENSCRKKETSDKDRSLPNQSQADMSQSAQRSRPCAECHANSDSLSVISPIIETK